MTKGSVSVLDWPLAPDSTLFVAVTDNNLNSGVMICLKFLNGLSSSFQMSSYYDIVTRAVYIQNIVHLTPYLPFFVWVCSFSSSPWQPADDWTQSYCPFSVWFYPVSTTDHLYSLMCIQLIFGWPIQSSYPLTCVFNLTIFWSSSCMHWLHSFSENDVLYLYDKWDVNRK